MAGLFFNACHAVVVLALSIFMLLSGSPSPATAASVQYNVVSLGAKADGKTDSSKAFQSAWASACGSTRAATVYIPQGRFLVRSASFDGPCKNSAITVRIDGTLVAPSDYNVNGNSGYWIVLRHVTGVSVIGGTLDGQGTGLWACKLSGKSCPSGATNLEISNSQNILVSGLSSLNSQMFHVVINGCQNVKMQGVKVSASGTSPNTDGIHIGASTGVTIFNSKIGTGDDCVSIGPGSNNLWIENVVCGPGHGISIGSLGKDQQEDGVQNVTIKTVTFTGTQNGVRIKSWARPSNSFARNILFQHAIMNNVQNPIIIDQNYCPDSGCPNQASGVRVSDVMYQDIHGTSATEVAVRFDCSSKYPCTGIRMQDVKLSYRNQVATASCAHAGGTASGMEQPSSCL
ncbi:polygalacturonase-like isoform X2 [Rhodamnia argentea]|uniref:Polygalacturonase-like isoform X2 n=1 Tax=Rhodamnia argentea TaxID=178133 RepID=A0A8B8PP93_9MYRT|nr:polygalacturonase-like isoform X2 [Rhodamnia argentea]